MYDIVADSFLRILSLTPFYTFTIANFSEDHQQAMIVFGRRRIKRGLRNTDYAASVL